MARGYRLTVRDGPSVTRAHYPMLSEALDALELRARALEVTARRAPVDFKVRRFEPVAQVAARVEVSGPGRLWPTLHGGVDIRGDGSAEAYVGRARRRLVAEEPGATAYAALRAALGVETGGAGRRSSDRAAP